MLPPKDPGGIRVMTLNLWGHSGGWSDRRQVLVDGLRALAPDLVAFQEAIRTDDHDQVVDVLGPDMHVAHHPIRVDGSGISIASRWPIERLTELDLRVTARIGDFPAAALAVEIEAPAPIGRLLFVNHLPAWALDHEYERELQAVIAARFIDEAVAGRDVHVVLAGDLDADPTASSVRFWTGRHALDGMSVCYRDAWESVHPEEPGHTFTPADPLMAPYAPDWPFRRIDYIFVRCAEHAGSSLAIAGCELAFSEPVGGIWASDHFGVLADVRAR
jgi:endonuclease/exonuclease/phosphatase family metal-dependent hydrolase